MVLSYGFTSHGLSCPGEILYGLGLMDTVMVPVYGSGLAIGVVGRLPAKLPIAEPGLDLVESRGDCGLVVLDGGRLKSVMLTRGLVPVGVDVPVEKLPIEDLDLSGVLCVDIRSEDCLDSDLQNFKIILICTIC